MPLTAPLTRTDDAITGDYIWKHFALGHVSQERQCHLPFSTLLAGIHRAAEADYIGSDPSQSHTAAPGTTSKRKLDAWQRASEALWRQWLLNGCLEEFRKRTCSRPLNSKQGVTSNISKLLSSSALRTSGTFRQHAGKVTACSNVGVA